MAPVGLDPYSTLSLDLELQTLRAIQHLLF